MNKRIECVTVGQIGTNCWLYPVANEANGKQPCVVIDPGDSAEKIISALKSLDWVPRYFFLTHGHWDHVMALAELYDAFAGEEDPPEIYIHRNDLCRLKDNSLAMRHFDEGDVIGPFRIMHTPGHTQGSVCFYDEQEEVIFTGDTLFQGNYGRTDLPGGDTGDMRESLKRLLALDGEITVCPGHGPATTIKEEVVVFAGI